MKKNIFCLIIVFSLPILSVNAWSTAHFAYNLCNKTYAKDFLHVNEQNGLFYTNSPYVQSITYLGNGTSNFFTQRYLIELDGCTPNCIVTLRSEIGRNFSNVKGIHICSGNSEANPVNLTSLNIYFGDNANPDHNIPPSITLHYCSLGLNIDNNLTFSPTKDPFLCLDSLTSSPPGTHLDLVKIGQDNKYFFNSTNYSPAAKYLAAAINNYAQIINSVALGINDGCNSALSKLNDIVDNLVPDHDNGAGKKAELIASFLSSFLIIPFPPLGATAEASFDIAKTVETFAVKTAIQVATKYAEQATVEVLVEEEAIAIEDRFLIEVKIYTRLAYQDFKPIIPTVNQFKDVITRAKVFAENGERTKAFLQMRRAMIILDDVNFGIARFPELVMQLYPDFESAAQLLMKIFYSDPFAVPASMRLTTVEDISDDSSLVVELGNRYGASSSRGPWRGSEADDLDSTSRKRDNTNSALGGVYNLGMKTIGEALVEISNDLNKSVTDTAGFIDQVHSTVSLLNSRFKDHIITNLNGTGVLNNFISSKIKNNDDLGRSLSSGFMYNFITARIISSVMAGYDTVICNNDVQYQCQQYLCNCNTPLGDDKITIAGGFGSDESYFGYRNNHLALISKWRDVSDIGRVSGGWLFNYDSCEGYKRKCGDKGGSGKRKDLKKRSTKYLSCSADDC